MMDLNEDLCKMDFFDMVPSKVEGSCEALTPVAFIDSIDYNNNGGPNLNSKSFLDEMLLTDSQTQIESLHQGNLEFLGTLHWSTGPSSSDLSLDRLDPSTPWQSDGEVTTLTNLLDPLFVSFEDSKMDAYLLGPNSGPNSAGGVGVISSDLITSTFLNDSSVSSPSESDLLTWQTNTTNNKNADGLSSHDESLLRSALQKQIPTTVLAKEYSPSQNQSQNQMTELRKVLSFPPLRNDTSPTPSDSHINFQINLEQHHLNLNNSSVIISSDGGDSSPYYELKVLDSVFVQPESVIPNVEELIMTRISNSNNEQYTAQKNQFTTQKKTTGGAISERKINSTTLSTKWTYTTNNNNEAAKARRRAKRAQNKAQKESEQSLQLPTLVSQLNSKDGVKSPPGPGSPPDDNSNGSSNNNSNSSSSAAARKERSLHYCNICCKGFKDKYSVNVHVRTHTGEKPFSCNLCGKNFRQKAHLAKHYQTHAAKANGTHPKSNVKRPNNNNNNNNNVSVNVNGSSNSNTITISSNSPDA